MKKKWHDIDVGSPAFYTHIAREAAKHSHPQKRELTRQKVPNQKKEIELIIELYEDLQTVLCVGCRTDSEVEAFEDYNLKASGLDVANETSKIKKIPAELIDKHYEESSIDLAYCSHSLEHVVVPEKVQENIRKVCKKGCYVILPLEPVDETPGFKHPVVYGVSILRSKDDQENTNLISSTLEKDFEQFLPYNLLHIEFALDEVRLAFEWCP